MGFEPTTPTLARLCSTPELHPLTILIRSKPDDGVSMAELETECNSKSVLLRRLFSNGMGPLEKASLQGV